MVQRTLLLAYKGIRRFHGEAKFSTWLYRITTNASHGLFRSRRAATRKLELYHEARAAEPPASLPHGENELEDLVTAFLSELTARQRQMMDLVDLQGYAPAEAAEMLGLNSNTARVHLLRARRHVREMILERAPSLAEDFG